MNKNILNYLLIILFAVSAAGCKPREKVYRIALAAPLTGDLAAMGQGMKLCAQIAVEEANASGRFKHKIELRPFDDRADPKEAVNIANQITSDPNIVAIIGHLNSGCSIPASQIYARHNLLMITPATTNPKLTIQQTESSWKWTKNIFRVNTTDDVQGQYAANFLLQNLKLHTVSVIHDKTPYGQGLAEEFKKEFGAKGGKVLSFNGISLGDKDFKALVTRIKSEKPDAVYFGGVYNEGGLIVKQARELGLKSVFMSVDAMQSPEYFKIAGVYADGSYITNVGVPRENTAQAKVFMEKFRAQYPNVDEQPYDHYTYEATNIALLALENAGMSDSDSVDRAKMIDYAGTVKYDGVLGHTEFDEKGDTKNKIITIYTVKNGKFEAID